MAAPLEQPLYQAKSELFRTLGHPVRIRVLELLAEGPQAVSRLLEAIPVEAARLSQQLAVLRGAGLVVAQRVGNTVEYSLSGTDVTDLLRTARQVLAHRTRGQDRLLAELRVEYAS